MKCEVCTVAEYVRAKDVYRSKDRLQCARCGAVSINLTRVAFLQAGHSGPFEFLKGEPNDDK